MFFRSLSAAKVIVFSFQLALIQVTGQPMPPGLSWEKIRVAKKGTLPVYWFESRPFIYMNENQQLAGIEYELIKGFADFVKKKYEVDLEIKWIEAESFFNTFERVQQSPSACLGASAFSITPDRQELLNFSPPYMTDIMVMISNKKIPVVESAEEFYSKFSKLRAVSIVGTTYDHDLKQLQQGLEMHFEIDYIPSAQNILQTVEARENAFGFIDLPIYMMYFHDNPSIQVRRQNLYPVRRDGYGLLMPKESDLTVPIREYFQQPSFHLTIEKIISNYLDLQLYRFVESLALKPDMPLQLLAKEKEIQQNDILKKTQEIEAKTRANYVLTGLVIIAFAFLVIIIILYKKSHDQRNKIVSQQTNIEFKNQQLQQRNQHLVTVDEEKNNLIKILAHDMRTPLNQMQGLTQILLTTNQNLQEDQQNIINHIQGASVRLNKMMSNILDIDAIESNRINFLPESILVFPFVQQTVNSFMNMASQKSISLTTTGESSDIKIKVDTLYMTQVLENLISNAIKFSEKGKSVEVAISIIQDKVRISVKDQGPGLTEADQANLFKKFQRLSTRPTNGEASIGLGLAIVKKYVELMGGRVWCESEPGMGAAFNVEFEPVD